MIDAQQQHQDLGGSIVDVVDSDTHDTKDVNLQKLGAMVFRGCGEWVSKLQSCSKDGCAAMMGG
ncbi:unnamed protein product [Dovyalis caffra]|uniref:Uncharacterized protein n=1 Tax=Dovyalis caffra TaxID=77055 RepID=A0AAV1SGE2_9ROSI|nr:unnamed protein product [Dovyalis caffra]